VLENISVGQVDEGRLEVEPPAILAANFQFPGVDIALNLPPFTVISEMFKNTNKMPLPDCNCDVKGIYSSPRFAPADLR